MGQLLETMRKKTRVLVEALDQEAVLRDMGYHHDSAKGIAANPGMKGAVSLLNPPYPANHYPHKPRH